MINRTQIASAPGSPPCWAVLLTLVLLSACGEQPAESSAGQTTTDSDAISASVADTDWQQRLQAAAEGEHRSVANRARNLFRHPVETLQFFGLRPEMTVVEVWPGGGWYSEVLAPALRDSGVLIAANFPESAMPPFRARIGADYLAKLAAEPQLYDQVRVVDFDPPSISSLGEPGSADMVLLSRHFHNFIRAKITDEVLAAAHQALKPGGVLAVVQHRAAADAVPESQQRDGYVRQQWLIDTITAAGFEFVASSEVNANPADQRDHPAGVWSLPPSLRSCAELEGEAWQTCAEQYRQIGESDRMTLRFSKAEPL